MHNGDGSHRCRSELLRGGLLAESGAQGERGVGVDGFVALVDEPDYALLVDDDVGAKRPLIVFILDAVGFQDAVGGEHFVVHVAEQRKRRPFCSAKAALAAGLSRLTPNTAVSEVGICPESIPAWTARICLVQPSENART